MVGGRQPNLEIVYVNIIIHKHVDGDSITSV